MLPLSLRAILTGSMSPLASLPKMLAASIGAGEAQVHSFNILAMAINITQAKPLFDQDRERFRQFLKAQASIRGLPRVRSTHRFDGIEVLAPRFY